MDGDFRNNRVTGLVPATTRIDWNAIYGGGNGTYTGPLAGGKPATFEEYIQAIARENGIPLTKEPICSC